MLPDYNHKEKRPAAGRFSWESLKILADRGTTN